MSDFWKIILFDMLFCFVFVSNIFNCLDNLKIKYEKRTKWIIIGYVLGAVIPLHFFWFVHYIYYLKLYAPL